MPIANSICHLAKIGMSVFLNFQVDSSYSLGVIGPEVNISKILLGLPLRIAVQMGSDR